MRHVGSKGRRGLKSSAAQVQNAEAAHEQTMSHAEQRRPLLAMNSAATENADSMEKGSGKGRVRGTGRKRFRNLAVQQENDEAAHEQDAGNAKQCQPLCVTSTTALDSAESSEANRRAIKRRKTTAKQVHGSGSAQVQDYRLDQSAAASMSGSTKDSQQAASLQIGSVKRAAVLGLSSGTLAHQWLHPVK